MSYWRRISYSISIAALLTALAWLFYPGIGEFLAVPGILIEGWVNILILMMSNEEYPFQFENWMGFSFLFYAASFYFALVLYNLSEVKEQKTPLNEERNLTTHSTGLD